MRVIICLTLAVLAVCQAQGPTEPLFNDCREEGWKVVDRSNMCWYHECQNDAEGFLRLLPRVCALGSRISYNFVAGMTNPCTINFDDPTGYVCARTQESVDGPPRCFTGPNQNICQNGGRWTYESDKCWCDCTNDWQGDFDCSKPTGLPDFVEYGSNVCVNGQPQEDFCRIGRPEHVCRNGGVCANNCDTVYCDCPNRDQYDYTSNRCDY